MVILRCVIVLCIFIGVGIAVPLTKYELTSVNDNALCNDGSPASYYFRKGSGSGANRWVIRLQGGGWCWDNSTCVSRKQYSVYWTTSTVLPATIADNVTVGPAGHEGILSSDPLQNPYFYNSNHVWLWYCSSDSHIGNISASESMNGWHFRGKVIVHSLIVDLLSSKGMKNASQILLTGDSAGGVATFSNVDYVWEIIKPHNPNTVYKAMVDAGWFLDIPSYNKPSFSFQVVAKALYSNWRVIYNENCLAAIGSTGEWRCFHGQYAWPHIRTPVFYQEYQYDSANLGFDGISSPWNANETIYSNNFRAEMVKLISQVPALFLPNCYQHESEDQLKFSRVAISKVTMDEAVWKWFVDPTSKPISYIDQCSGVGCNPDCIF